MAQEIITLEDLQKFRLQLLEDLRRLLQQPNHSQKQWLKSSEVRKMLGISYRTLQTSVSKMYYPIKRSEAECSISMMISLLNLYL
jgi:hypothetical protein